MMIVATVLNPEVSSALVTVLFVKGFKGKYSKL